MLCRFPEGGEETELTPSSEGFFSPWKTELLMRFFYPISPFSNCLRYWWGVTPWRALKDSMK